MSGHEQTLTRTEVVLHSTESGDYVILHTKRLAVGDVIETASGWWVVSEEAQPTNVGAQARYICVRCPAPLNEGNLVLTGISKAAAAQRRSRGRVLQ